MKQILIVCLLGIALLPASATVNGKTKFAPFFKQRIVDVGIHGYDLQASSDSETGTITKVEIYDKETEVLLITEYCSEYSCSVWVGELPSGDYVAKVITSLTVYSESFHLN